VVRPALLVLLAAASIAARPPIRSLAQPPLDFSGRWILDASALAMTPAEPGRPASVAAPGDLGSGWGPTITIAQDARRLIVEYTPFSRYDLQPPLTFTYPLDGSTGRNVVMLGRGEQLETSTARWDGEALIVTTTLHVDERRAGTPFTTELTRRLRLDGPATLIVEVTRAGVLGGPPSTTRSIYRKGTP
jgi:hypothetical protein